MIQTGTFVNIIDNSGAKKGLCIKILNSGYQQRYAHVGDLVLISIKTVKFSPNLKVQKGEMHKALIVRTKTPNYSFSSNYTKFYENSVILLNKQYKPLGTRIFGVIPKAFKYTKFLKIATLSSGLIF